MEPIISFKLSQRADAKGKKGILLVVNCGLFETKGDKKLYTPLLYPTGKKVHHDNWNGRPTYRPKKDSDLKTEISNFETEAKKVVKELTKTKTLTNVNIKNGLDKIYNPSKDLTVSTLNGYIAKYVDSIESGTRLTSSLRKFSPGTVKQFKSFENVFQLFQKHQKKTYDFSDIDNGFYKAYTGFLTSVEVKIKDKVVKEKYSPNTIGSHVKRLKMILMASREDGLHTNTFINTKAFKVINERTPQIYLSDYEVRCIYDLKLTGKLDIIRDVFLAGCYTAQRFSDYSKIEINNVRGQYIYLTQQKTKAPVIIPIKPELRNILIKYNFTLPYVYEAELNKNIKMIARLAGITKPIVYQKIKGGEVDEITQDKCTLVTSHTARRSGCTNLYLNHINTHDIMKISGHKSEKELLNYIRVNEQETAEKLSTDPYFMKEYQPLKIAL